MTGPSPDVRLLVPALLAWAVCGSTLGVDAGLRAVAGAVLLAVAAVSAAVLVVRRRRGPRHARYRPGGGAAAVVLVCAACGLTLGAAGLHGLVRDAGTVRDLAGQRAAVTLAGQVVSDPRRLAGPGATVALRLAVHRVDGRGQRSAVHARVLVFGGAAWAAVHWGEHVVAHGRLAPARAGDDVVATVAARGPPVVVRPASRTDQLAERMRTGLRQAARSLAPDPAGLLPGLVVGDTSLQPDDLGEAMRATGLTHLAAVSGTNTTMVCVLALGLSRAAGLGRRWRLVAAGAMLTGFVVLARPEPSVLRAAVMGALGLLAFGTSRRRAAVPALCTAVVLLLVTDPWLARSYGFALSVLATSGLLLLAGPLAERMSRRVPRVVAVALAVPVSAQLVCSPVIVLLSGQVSLVSVPANLLAEPLVAPATLVGLAAAVASLASPSLATALAHVAGLPCHAITAVARALARVPHAQVPWAGGATGAVALAVVTAATLLLGPRAFGWAARHRGPASALAAVLLAAAVPLPSAAAWPPAGWVLVACDVGQGDALVLSTGPARAVLVDAGPEPRAVDRCLHALGVRTLDAVVLTHFHADHVAGLAGAVHGRRVGPVVVTIVDDPPAQARRVRALAAKAGLRVRTVTDGEQVRDGPLSWRVLWPARVIHDGSVPNNSSIVLDVRTRGLRLLLLGDVEPAAARAVAQRLEASADGPRVDVLKVAHHGSALQDPGLLAATHPRLALVSVGADNDYGHPSPGVLRLLAGQGARTARTDQQGDLAVVVHGDVLELATSGPRRRAVGGRR